MKRMILALLLAAGCTESGGLDLDEKEHVEYRVTGTGIDVTVTWVTDGHTVEQRQNTVLPFTYSGTFEVGSYISVIATTYDRPDRTVSCEIMQDGRRVASDSAGGAFNSAECRGTVQ